MIKSRVNAITQEQIKQIHNSACEILEDAGVVVHHDEALELLKSAGCVVENSNRVYIPTGLVEKSISTVPSRVTLYDRNGNPKIFMQEWEISFGTGSDTINYLDPYTKERRKWLKKDVEDAVKVCDYLPHIDFIMSMGNLVDVNKHMINREQYALMLLNSTKPQVVIAEDDKTLEDIIEMAAAAVGGREVLKRKPLFMVYCEPTSPLQLPYESVAKVLLAAETNIPTNFACGGLSGGTVPMTVSGSVLQAHTEALSGLVIHQLKNPGAPFVYGYGITPLDMKTLQSVYTSAESMVAQGMLCDIARYFNFPSWGYAGCSSSKTVDEQAVMEATMFTLMGALQGCNLMHDIFYLEFGLTGALEMIVISDDTINRVKHMIKGVDTSREALGTDTIKMVGPGGNFMGTQHTVENFRKGWSTELCDLQGFEGWERSGKLTLFERANQKVKEIIESHQPEPVCESIITKVIKILEDAERKL
ncbi:MAG: trimethylamine methyltransferase [Desulfitibacter sp. BRH_c19]|nr:MAG: trimethylamine methyltransferase [Desulfitibacter sp. BRH_c19]